jgi:acetyl-CoA acetyltransferase
MREVAILGVGMHPFGAYYSGKSNGEMALTAGLAALDDAGLTFADVNAAYVGHIFAHFFKLSYTAYNMAMPAFTFPYRQRCSPVS